MFKTEVLVIGGGATGAGIARDLALRGAEVTLIEGSDFAFGASGRCHGMLHSGARYAVTDPISASECAIENKILKRIADFCIEDTGGFFIGLPNDDECYPDLFMSACRKAGVDAIEISVNEALKEEPLLSENIVASIDVPDASIDPFMLVLGNIESARSAGSTALNYHLVRKFDVRESRIEKVYVENLRNGSIDEYRPEIVINATGAWANHIAALAGVSIDLTMDKGSMVVLGRRFTHRLINRLRKPSNGDIVVPNYSSSIIGTTSITVSSPTSTSVMEQEVDLLMREAAMMMPPINASRAIRAYAGIRPLVSRKGGDSREISRTFQLIDHSEKGIENLISVIGGKLTTYRLMAEKVSDIVCSRLGISASCRTSLEPLSIPYGEMHNKMIGRGSPTVEIQTHENNGELRRDEVVCSCEKIKRQEVEFWASHPDVRGLSDVTRRTRAGMGYCQSGLCVFNLLTMLIEYSDTDPLYLLTEYLKEREKGIKPVLLKGQIVEEIFKECLLNGVYHISDLAEALRNEENAEGRN